MDNSPLPLVQRPARKQRRRPALACEQCRVRKVRCDRNSPCGTCVRFRPGNLECTYALAPPALPRGTRRAVPTTSSGSQAIPVTGIPLDPIDGGESPASSAALSSLAPSTSAPLSASNDTNNHTDTSRARDHMGRAGPINFMEPFARQLSSSNPSSQVSSSSAAAIGSLERRVKQLEKELQLALGAPPSSSGNMFPSRRRAAGDVWHTPRPKVPPEPREIEKSFVSLPIRGIMSKTRFFGQSHWANGANFLPPKYKVLLHVMDRAQQEKTSRIYDRFQKCKTLARTIKARRVPALPGMAIGEHIPTRSVADTLVDNYLRTFETVYRVVHIPSFQAEYDRYWEQPQAASQAFIVLMQLCLAIGACFHNDTHSLRAQATGWIYEARVWFLLPPDKAKLLTIPGLQILCLLQIAKQTTGVAADLAWVSAGSLLRAAMLMGLHHDPDNLTRMPLLHAEMRRRLWATILEIDLQASLDTGTLPLISPHDFDTRPPANLDDADLTRHDTSSTTTAENDQGYTQTSAQAGLFATFATRLAITNLINDPHCGSSNAPNYQDTLRLSAELTSHTRSLMQHLHSLPRGDHDSGGSGISPFQLRFIEMAMHRHQLALHLPWWSEAQQDPRRYFSRKTAVDAALALAALVRTPPRDGTNPEGEGEKTDRSHTDFDRLIVCGSGPYRSAPIHASLVLGLEAICLKEEERRNRGLTGAGAAAMGHLRAVFDWTTRWWARRIQAGETNVKSYAFGEVLGSLVEAIEANMSGEATMALVMEQATVRVEECYEMLKAAAGDVEVGDVVGAEENVDLVGQNDGGGVFAGMDFLMEGFFDELRWDDDMVELDQFRHSNADDYPFS
ncbi:fungal-specific transcription factor domain-containing protein [Podospora didyma]|uniref:Fungal-specific transcription factor domain-containing protein n=1 Tax=Podospora didyma TaxID=330526 RepID=A0AAE0TZJ3_9PEZI|nr:fungal-specific transcription factor domain-containing protein [Podospora didyma]